MSSMRPEALSVVLSLDPQYLESWLAMLRAQEMSGAWMLRHCAGASAFIASYSEIPITQYQWIVTVFSPTLVLSIPGLPQTAYSWWHSVLVRVLDCRWKNPPLCKLHQRSTVLGGDGWCRALLGRLLGQTQVGMERDRAQPGSWPQNGLLQASCSPNPDLLLMSYCWTPNRTEAS